MILELSLAGLLILGSVQDLKTRTVSNIITGSIAVLSFIYFINIPYREYFSRELLYFFWLHFITVGGIFLSYKLQAIGGADLKAMVPLIFTLSTVPLFLFLLISTLTHGIINLYEKRVPYFIPLTTAFILVTFCPAALRDLLLI